MDAMTDLVIAVLLFVGGIAVGWLYQEIRERARLRRQFQKAFTCAPMPTILPTNTTVTRHPWIEDDDA